MASSLSNLKRYCQDDIEVTALTGIISLPRVSMLADMTFPSQTSNVFKANKLASCSISTSYFTTSHFLLDGVEWQDT